MCMYIYTNTYIVLVILERKHSAEGPTITTKFISLRSYAEGLCLIHIKTFFTREMALSVRSRSDDLLVETTDIARDLVSIQFRFASN